MIVLSKASIRVLISDDHPMLRQGVRDLLEGAPDVTVIAETNCGTTALRLIGETEPDIAVIDIAMPDMNGIAVLKQMLLKALATQVVILSAHEERTFVREAFNAGARGYVLKRSAGEHLLQAIRSVHGGSSYLDPTIADRFTLSGAIAGPGMTKLTDLSKPELTDRERDVFRFIALGYTNKEIAEKLGVTSKSVETYRHRAGEKLQIRTRAKIVQYAMFQGWFENLCS